MLRLWVVGAAVWMALVLAMTVVRNASSRSGPNWLVAGAGAAAIALVLVADVIGAEGFVARHNIERARQGADLDIGYLDPLSDDAVPAIAGALEDADDVDAADDPAVGNRLLWALDCHDDRQGAAALNVAAARAAQLVDWQRTHRFCGQCATPTEPATRERARRCPRCGLMAFPRLAPAVIMLIERDDGRILLARSPNFPAPFFSLLAGFVEPGEGLEEAVMRETLEEVGAIVDDITYWGSQPWPFPHSLMIGFRARYVSGDLVLQDDEIAEAGWFGPDELPMVPPAMSIAGQMIEAWRTARC